MMSPTDTLPLVVTIPDFGAAALNHKSENPSYEAARAGVFPVIEYGIGQKVKRKVVPVRRALKEIAGNDPAMLEAVTNDFFVRWRALVESRQEKRRRRKSGAP
jgi:hypothetical protein